MYSDILTMLTQEDTPEGKKIVISIHTLGGKTIVAPKECITCWPRYAEVRIKDITTYIAYNNIDYIRQSESIKK